MTFGREISLSFYIAALLALASIPAAAFGLGIVLDRLLHRRSTSLGVLAVVLATAASLAILLLPLRLEGVPIPGSPQLGQVRRSILEQEGVRGLLMGAIPVAIAAFPVLLQVFLGSRRFDRLGGGILGAAYVASLGVLVVAMLFLSASFVGFLYLPSVAALGVAGLRASARPAAGETAPGNRQAVSWLVPILLLAVPFLAIAAWFIATAELGSGPGEGIERGGDIQIRAIPTPTTRP